MFLAPLILAAATARAPVPLARAPAVSQTDATRLLRAEYPSEKPRLRGDWPAAPGEGDGARRSVCVDGGSAPGARLVAVCTRYPDVDPGTPGRVDLFLLHPPATRRDKAALHARYRGIPTGAAGAPGPVRLITVGPSTTAFALTSFDESKGWRSERVALYVEHEGRLRERLAVATALSNAGTCRPGNDAAGRRCQRRLVTLTCTLRVDRSTTQHGLHPLELRVSGMRGGEPVQATIPIPHDAFGYRISARVLETKGCNSRG